MILVIAEKPSLGRAIADAIPGNATTKDGCIYKGNYVITWVFGHLLTLKSPSDYDEKYKTWALDALPINFENWELKIDDDNNKTSGISKRQRVEQIGALLKQSESVIHAGDPDEEGQLLVDEILRLFRYSKPVMRLNTSDTTVGALRKALKNMVDNRTREAEGWSAYARSVADLLIGVNMSRFFTLTNEVDLLSVGRVQTPTLGLVVKRDYAIENHIKTYYYNIFATLDIDGKEVTALFKPRKDNPHLTDGKILSKTYADSIANNLRGHSLDKIEITKEIVTEAPPLPFNLVKLQTYCAKMFGYSPQEVMDITQSLRETHTAITYNRSDCQYLSDEHFKEAPATMQQVIQNINFKPQELDMSIKSKCFNAANITAHHAIIPTNKACDIRKMSEQERNVYLAICKYYMAQFMPPAKKRRTSLKTVFSNGDGLTATSTETIELGYISIFKEIKVEDPSVLSKFDEGIYKGKITSTEVKESETKPPARYTEASLNEDMTRIARYVDDPQIKELLLKKDKDKKGENGSIGTTATRTLIISTLLNRGYIEKKGKHIISTTLGREFYRILPDELKKPDMTAKWWVIQEEIKQGTKTPADLQNNVLQSIRDIIASPHPSVDYNLIPKQSRGGIGVCPLCGNSIIENKVAFGCSNYKNGCKFTIWKKPKLPSFAKKTITAANVKSWLQGKPVRMTNLISRTGKTFTANVSLKIDPAAPCGTSFELTFPQQRQSIKRK